MKNFNGLSLITSDVIENSLNIISTAGALGASHTYKELADELIDIVHQYLKEASTTNHSGCFFNNQDNISFRIQLARENLGFSESDLANTLNTYSDHISDWECGITEPPASMIIPLANALKCDPLWLLTGEITPQASSDNVEQQHHRASQQVGGVSREVLRQ